MTQLSLDIIVDLLPFITTISKIVLVIVALLLGAAYLIFAERKVIGYMQLRTGPSVVGPFGLFQPLADGLKLMHKEIIVPLAANKVLFFVAPILFFTTSMAAWGVIPINTGWVLSDLNLGILYLLAMSSLNVYGIIIAGWASNSKYALLGAVRSAAQMISYEVSISFIMISVAMCAGTLNLSGVVMAQKNMWYCLKLCPLFIIFFISCLAETNRTPFDLPEAEAELVAGYHVEYSSAIFSLFILMSTLCALLFMGGWLPPFNLPIFLLVPGWIWLSVKVYFFLFLFIWVRATLPRYRYDQLMRLGWKIFLPINLAAIVIVAFCILWWA